MSASAIITLPAPDINPLSGQSTSTRTTTTPSSRSLTSTRGQTSTGVGSSPTRTPSSSTTSSPSTTLSTTPSNVTSTSSSAAGFQEASGSSFKKQTPVGLIVGLVLGLLVLVALALFFTRRYLIHRRQRRITPAKARMGLAISGPTDFQHITGGLNALQQSGSSPFPGATSTAAAAGSIGARTGARGAEMSKAELASAYNPSRQKGDDQTIRRGDLTSGSTLNRPVVGSNISDTTSSSGNGIRGGGGSGGGSAADVWATFESEVGEGNATSSRAIRQKYSFDFNTLESGLSNHMDTMRNGHKSPRLQN